MGDAVTLTVDPSRRAAIARNHSATHLLDAALREVLGTHIRQAGSYVDDKEARFDFTHFAAVTREELTKVERLVNEKILEDLPVTPFETDIESAKASGAIALFGEKYGNIVRVVKMGDFSSELCGGTHVSNTAKIGMFKITMENSVAAGVRRITAVTGLNTYELMLQSEAIITSALKALKVGARSDILMRIAALGEEMKAVKKELEAASTRLASAKADTMVADAVKVGGIRTASMQTELPLPVVRFLGDDLKSRYSDLVAVIASRAADKVTLVCVCGKEALARGLKAPYSVSGLAEYVGGSGGGRPDSATAGVKYPERLSEALSALPKVVEALIK